MYFRAVRAYLKDILDRRLWRFSFYSMALSGALSPAIQSAPSMA